MKHYFSEFIGTFGFVFIGWGAAVFAAPFIGYLGISIAFGLAYAAMSLAFPAGHFNPAATLAAALAGRFASQSKIKTVLNVLGYVLIQTAGACAAAALINFVYSGRIGYIPQEIAGINIVKRYSLSAAFYLELILNFLFLILFLKTFDDKSGKAFSCGFFITAAYLLSYPVTRGAINPARTTATALFGCEEAINQLPVFWGSALAAALLAGLIYNKRLSKIFTKEAA